MSENDRPWCKCIEPLRRWPKRRSEEGTRPWFCRNCRGSINAPKGQDYRTGDDLPRNYRKEICKHWLKGECYNDLCPFAHGEDQLRRDNMPVYGPAPTIFDHIPKNSFSNSEPVIARNNVWPQRSAQKNVWPRQNLFKQKSPLPKNQLADPNERTRGQSTESGESAQDPALWTIEEVRHWLDCEGLSSIRFATPGDKTRVLDLFVREEIDGEALLDLAKNELRELGLRAKGNRKKLWQKLRLLRT